MKQIAYLGLDHHHCEPYLESLAQLPVETTCAYEPNESIDVHSIDGLGSVPLYRDLDQLFTREAVDILWVTLPSRDTPAVISRGVERGIDVYTEKTGAKTAAELTQIANAVDQSTASVGFSYTWRSHPIARELQQRAADGFYGDIRSIETRFVTSKLDSRNTDHYLYDRSTSRGGILQWLGVHWIDLLAWMLGVSIARVNVSLRRGHDGVDVEDRVTMQFETESGALGTLNCGYYLSEGRYDTGIEIYGTSGRSSWDPMGETFGFDGETELELESIDGQFTSAPRRTTTYEYEPKPGYGGEWGLEYIQEFLQTGVSGSRVADIGDAIDVLQILDAAYESAETGQWVAVNDR